MSLKIVRSQSLGKELQSFCQSWKKMHQWLAIRSLNILFIINVRKQILSILHYDRKVTFSEGWKTFDLLSDQLHMGGGRGQWHFSLGRKDFPQKDKEAEHCFQGKAFTPKVTKVKSHLRADFAILHAQPKLNNAIVCIVRQMLFTMGCCKL